MPHISFLRHGIGAAAHLSEDIRNKEAINADLDESFAQAARGEGYSPEESRALLARTAPPAQRELCDSLFDGC